ncbi:Vacuolar protein-sorting-associated protein 25, partial [Cladochytrium tenue]
MAGVSMAAASTDLAGSPTSWAPPPIFGFPPFFTEQPTEATWQKQKELWGDVILSFCRARRVFVLDPSDALASPLFSNKLISRSVQPDVAVRLLDHLVANGRAQWLNPGSKQRCIIWWRRPEEWAAAIYDW